ncbi:MULTISPECIES: type III secretion protein [unclassified Brenneria]|uniref:type III secretion protein n=1 Tax=unclassified Brenneria TaxID=2634434 RepID=UPI0029C50B53|nr:MULTISPECIES: type III secretion protein [unclassified Brenneria]MDX5626679.1 type III secretion protein [Brenneria sp. L3-3Z]MDX5693971.1 type III secretion protein [Brenneria sp. L4-2C]MEE3661388.1 type III secretion protein [Brenneria sp. g21c3]
MTEEAAIFQTQNDFLAAMTMTPAGDWRPTAGVSLRFRRSARETHLQLLLAPERRYPGMLQQLLQRRFLEAETLADCYLSINERREVMLCCPLPAADAERRLAISKLWRLAGLAPL